MFKGRNHSKTYIYPRKRTAALKGCISFQELLISFVSEELLSLYVSVLSLNVGIYHVLLSRGSISFFHAH